MKIIKTYQPDLPAFLKIYLVLSISLVALGLIAAPAKAQETEGFCLNCHGKTDIQMTLPSGEVLPLNISNDQLKISVHSSNGIECEACHTEIKSYPHPALSDEIQTRRDLARSLYQACKKCHSQNYTKTMDSMHAQAAVSGNQNAPICTDCHGVHDVTDPDAPRARVSTTCSQCHAQIFEQYKDSVHGAALLTENNPDVPVCTDCHGVHNIQDPRTPQFRAATPELCATCHANAPLMEKYGINPNVARLYNLSWHGVEVSFYKSEFPTIWHENAVCTDCHGVHHILKADNPASSVNPANLLVTCQKCHPGAGPNWTGAWTGHNETSPTRTPFAFYTEAFYSSFVPVVLWASIIYVALQIIRATVNRVRRSLS